MAAAVILATAMGTEDTAMAMGDTIPMDMVTGLIIRGLATVITAGRIITDHTTGHTVTESITVAVGGKANILARNILS
jgi:hypothetical protein